AVERPGTNCRLLFLLLLFWPALPPGPHPPGAPRTPPLPLVYPDDPNVRQMADEKLLGRDVLVATVSTYGKTARDVYLPAGTWIDFHTNACLRSTGEWVRDVPTRVAGLFSVPAFARAGAIVPEMTVDDETLNALGKRR